MSGRFIVVEGIDGSGTTTQIQAYAEHLRSLGRDVHVTREPSGGPIGRSLREIMTGQGSLLAGPDFDLMALLFAADRIDHVRGEIEPALARGAVVLCDRYDLSSLAYQSVTSNDVVPAHEVVAWIRSMNRFARRPDVTLVVDVHPDVARTRRAARGGPPELYETTALQSRLAKAYLHAEALVPNDRVVHVRGEGSIDEVATLIRAALAPWLVPTAR